MRASGLKRPHGSCNALLLSLLLFIEDILVIEWNSFQTREGVIHFSQTSRDTYKVRKVRLLGVSLIDIANKEAWPNSLRATSNRASNATYTVGS